MTDQASRSIRHYFVDEAGDGTLLQAVDYLLWALQRLYERREDRYLQYVWPLVRLVHDVDDTRTAQYGVYYTQKKPLTVAALEGLPGI